MRPIARFCEISRMTLRVKSRRKPVVRREAAKKNGREAYEEASYRAYEHRAFWVASLAGRGTTLAPESSTVAWR
jgi:hypothetical protein